MNVVRPVLAWYRTPTNTAPPSYAPGESYALISRPLPRGYPKKILAVLYRTVLTDPAVGVVVVYATSDNCSTFLRTYGHDGEYRSSTLTRAGTTLLDALEKSIQSGDFGVRKN